MLALAPTHLIPRKRFLKQALRIRLSGLMIMLSRVESMDSLSGHDIKGAQPSLDRLARVYMHYSRGSRARVSARRSVPLRRAARLALR